MPNNADSRSVAARCPANPYAANPYAAPRADNRVRVRRHLQPAWVGPMLCLGSVSSLACVLASLSTLIPQAEWKGNVFILTTAAAGAFCTACAFGRYRTAKQHNTKLHE